MRINGKRILILVLSLCTVLTVIPRVAVAIPRDATEYLGKALLKLLEEKTALKEEESDAPEKSDASQSEEASSEEEPSRREIAVEGVNLARYTDEDEPSLYLINETDFKVDLNAFASEKISLKDGKVLIVHTHGTESYLPDGAGFYREGENFRSTDKSENVVAVGVVFAETLKNLGIEVIHDQTLYDEHSYSESYGASRAAVKRRLSEDPSIAFVIDIHRDSITASDQTAKKTLCTVNGEKIAQVMLVVGTDAAGAAHPSWQTNLRLAAKYQTLLNDLPTFARPIYLRSASYNQQLSNGSLLLEIGSGANTLTEAKRAAYYSAEKFAELIFSLKSNA